MRAMLSGLRNGWVDYLTDKARGLRDQADIEHREWIPLLMDHCDHILRTPYVPVGDEPVGWLRLVDAGLDQSEFGEPLMCHRCAGMHKVPGAAGQRLMLLLKLADFYDALAGDRGPT